MSIILSAVLFGTVAGISFNYVTELKGNGMLSAMLLRFDRCVEYGLATDSDKDTADSGSEDNGNGANDSADIVNQEENTATAEDDEKYEVSTVSFTGASTAGSGSLDVSDIAKAVMPSVVSINVKAVTDYYMWYGYGYETEGSGSGIIIGKNDTELLIVTNNHVVEDATEVNVSFIDGETYNAIVKGTDSDNDIAIIVVKLNELSKDTLSQIEIAKLGNSDDIEVGEQVVAIGNALGYGQSVTTGIVSAKDRVVSTNVIPLIQTDAAINPGNSGGALLNMKGEVIGINSSKYMSTEVEGIGYAIPISKIESILDNLMNKKTRELVEDENRRGYLGISCSTLGNSSSYWYFDYGGNDVSGVYVNEVAKGTPAYKSGIKNGDIITHFDGQQVSSVEELTKILQYYEAGEIVEVKVLREKDGMYEEKIFKIKLVSKDRI